MQKIKAITEKPQIPLTIITSAKVVIDTVYR